MISEDLQEQIKRHIDETAAILRRLDIEELREKWRTGYPDKDMPNDVTLLAGAHKARVVFEYLSFRERLESAHWLGAHGCAMDVS